MRQEYFQPAKKKKAFASTPFTWEASERHSFLLSTGNDYLSLVLISRSSKEEKNVEGLSDLGDQLGTSPGCFQGNKYKGSNPWPSDLPEPSCAPSPALAGWTSGS